MPVASGWFLTRSLKESRSRKIAPNKQQPEEKAFRAIKARIDPRWHRNAADGAETANEWYAAAFHWAWVLKASRQQGRADDEQLKGVPERLAAAYANWLAEWQAASTGVEPRPAPELLWPEYLRDMLVK